MADSGCLSNRRRNEANSYASTHIAFPSEKGTVSCEELLDAMNGCETSSENEEDSLANTRATTAYSLIIGVHSSFDPQEA
jgi:hypothetical protein